VKIANLVRGETRGRFEMRWRKKSIFKMKISKKQDEGK
jgi:hypothetical protein